MADTFFTALDRAACEVLGRYPIRPENFIALGNSGGFSGARLWRVQTTVGSHCLRAWPPRDLTPERLSWIHGLMRRARDAGLDVVPAVTNTAEGVNWVQHAGRLWDLTTWMPGRADFHDRPTRVRLESACAVLARLHSTWHSTPPVIGPCPGVIRRLEIARDWIDLIHSGWRLPRSVHGDDPVHACAERAWKLLPLCLNAVPRALALSTERLLPLQPCLCDIWHDHVLFDGDDVTGLIDYGGVKIDHVAVDLARLLGSLVEDHAEERCAGLIAYTRLRPLSWEEQSLVQILDETGTVIAVANWLKWLYRDQTAFGDRTAVAQRLAKLVDRMEKWWVVSGGW